MTSHTIAVIGLGIMGGPMAANLVKAGFDVIGYNRSPRGIDRLISQGGRGAASIAVAVAGADVVITMVPADADVKDVILGDAGVLASARPGTLVIDMSTVTPRTSIEVAAAAQDAGMRTLDAPVSGGEAGAVEGVLSIMVGGAEADFADAQPILKALGTTIVHVGPAGAGQTVKAANQLIVAVNIEALAEAVVLLERAGVDLGAALDVLAGGMAGSTVLNRRRAAMERRDFKPGFRIDLHHKDMGILADTARALEVSLPAGSVAGQMIASARACGDGALDHSVLLLGVERLSGMRAGGSGDELQ